MSSYLQTLSAACDVFNVADKGDGEIIDPEYRTLVKYSTNENNGTDALQIYVLILENDKIFLYTTTHGIIEKDRLWSDPEPLRSVGVGKRLNSVDEVEGVDEQSIFIECEIMYDFVRNNKPRKTIDIIQINHVLEIDFHVKTYMYNFGIDNVRGGSYCSEILPTYMTDALNAEFSLDSKTFIENRMNMQLLYDQYGNKSTFIWNEANVLDEIKCMNDELIKYKKKKYLFSKMNIDRTLINDINWIKSIVGDAMERQAKCHSRVSYIEKTNKYRTIIEKFKKIYPLFSGLPEELGEYNISYEPKIYLTRPDLLFDTFIYHTQKLDKPHYCAFIIAEAETLIVQFEYMIYTLINRADEYNFDISTYIDNFEHKINNATKYLKLIWQNRYGDMDRAFA